MSFADAWHTIILLTESSNIWVDILKKMKCVLLINWSLIFISKKSQGSYVHHAHCSCTHFSAGLGFFLKFPTIFMWELPEIYCQVHPLINMCECSLGFVLDKCTNILNYILISVLCNPWSQGCHCSCPFMCQIKWGKVHGVICLNIQLSTNWLL